MSNLRDTASNDDAGSDVPDTGDGIPNLGSGVDMQTFSQILEMDDDGDRSFSKGLIVDFITQAEETFGKMKDSLTDEDLQSLSEQGHYLKGSSATLGLNKLRDSCEKIQRYGKKENADGTPEPNVELNLARIKEVLTELKSDYASVAVELKRFYGLDNDDEDSVDESAEEESSASPEASKETVKDSTKT